MKRTGNRIIRSVMLLEIVLAAFIIFSVIASGYHLLLLLVDLLVADSARSYEIFQNLLAQVLLMVIGLELALMLIRHTPSRVIEVMLYAVARKMLIYTTQTWEIAIGVLALGGLFAIWKYLYLSPEETREKEEH